ncbi:PREDICTED: calpain-9-like [Nanorana parkeri]|uniref:calpain-9-like n=1 Tax=Nanorana parkeri TaxID=125878 RepID=UPI000854A11A|nr:PREDICTED: calpain-9-like [Nanorana parkeri]
MMEPLPSKRIKSTHPDNDSSLSRATPLVSQQLLFVDSTFPQDEALQVEGIKWKRPEEICDCPRFIVDGATRMDICQGNLSNCWFLSAVACLSLYPQLLEQVMPTEQDFGDGYNGKFRFQFWQYGKWVEVVVDDLLPTVQTLQNGRDHYNLLFVNSKDKNEFWSSLLEKAYAKLKGGYSALQMGFAGEALEDLTGGVVQSSNTNCPAPELWRLLDNILQRRALICCGNTQGEIETSNLMGILSHHMYSVTGTKEVQTIQGPVSLLRVRNPWGHTEWTGPWRDGGPEWHTVIKPDLTENVILEDGEFWIAVEDFKENFQFLEICHLGPQSLLEIGGAAKPWDYVMYEGRWVKGLSAGGGPTSDYYWMNPQFSLTLSGNDNNTLCSFIVSVMQKHQRLRRITQRVACHIFQGDDAHAYLFQDKLRSLEPLLSAGPCINHREVVICTSLPPGRYIIIPSLEECNEGEFLVRLLTEKGNPSRALETSKEGKEILTLSMCPTEAEIQSRFLKFANQDCRINPVQLHRLLASLLSEFVPLVPSFPPETCRCLLASQDISAVGSLDWEQFYTLWKKIIAGMQIFCNAQKDKDDRISIDQLVPALKAAGLPVDDFLVRLVQLRYGDQAGFLSYHHFICCLLKFQSLTEKFQAADPAGSGTVTLSYRQWLLLAVYS